MVIIFQLHFTYFNTSFNYSTKLINMLIFYSINSQHMEHIYLSNMWQFSLSTLTIMLIYKHSNRVM